MSKIAFLQGFGLSFALIAAVGPQNLHVLRVGLARRHVSATIAMCVGADAVLVTGGLAGAAGALQSVGPALLPLHVLACLALLWMALRALRDARRARAVTCVGGADGESLGRTLAATAIVTLVNPSVWIESVLLIGAAGAVLPPPERCLFGAGALSASLLWFTGLGYGAGLAADWLARAAVWRFLALAAAAGMAASAVAVAGQALELAA